jgi:hypothetical protein
MWFTADFRSDWQKAVDARKKYGMISAVITYEDGRVSIHDSATKIVGTKFERGFYTVFTDQNGNLIISTAELQEIHMPYSTKDNLATVNTVEGFFAKGVEQKIKDLGFIHKLGILLHGRQGTGKTALLHFIAEKLRIERNAIVFFCNESANLSAAVVLATMIRQVQDNPVVFIADEFERYAKNAEAPIKNLLDGNTSIHNTLFLAATNYLTDIPATIKDRPSRFKIVQEITGMTDKSLMVTIIKNISDRISPSLFTDDEIWDAVKDRKDATIDELKHVCLDKATNTFIVPVRAKRSPIGFMKTFLGVGNDDNENYSQLTIHDSEYISEPPTLELPNAKDSNI